MKSWFEFIKADAEANPEMSAQEWLDWKKRKRKLGKPGKASMTKPKNLKRQTDGELEEIKKDPHKDNNYMDAGGNPQKKKAKDARGKVWRYGENMQRRESQADESIEPECREFMGPEEDRERLTSCGRKSDKRWKEKTDKKKPYDPSKNQNQYDSEEQAMAAPGATGVIQHRDGKFTAIFGDRKERDRIRIQVDDHNKKRVEAGLKDKPNEGAHFEVDQNISDLSGEEQEKAKSVWKSWLETKKGLDPGDDRPPKRPRKERDEGYGSEKPRKEKKDPRRDRRRGGEDDYDGGKRARRRERDEDEDERDRHRDEERGPKRQGHGQVDVPVPRDSFQNTQGHKIEAEDDPEDEVDEQRKEPVFGGVALPRVERKPSLGRQTRVSQFGAGLQDKIIHRHPNAPDGGMSDISTPRGIKGLRDVGDLGTISAENAEKWKSWLEKKSKKVDINSMWYDMLATDDQAKIDKDEIVEANTSDANKAWKSWLKKRDDWDKRERDWDEKRRTGWFDDDDGPEDPKPHKRKEREDKEKARYDEAHRKKIRDSWVKRRGKKPKQYVGSGSEQTPEGRKIAIERKQRSRRRKFGTRDSITPEQQANRDAVNERKMLMAEAKRAVGEASENQKKLIEGHWRRESGFDIKAGKPRPQGQKPEKNKPSKYGPGKKTHSKTPKGEAAATQAEWDKKESERRTAESAAREKLQGKDYTERKYGQQWKTPGKDKKGIHPEKLHNVSNPGSKEVAENRIQAGMQSLERVKSWLAVYKTGKKWRCNLCNIELPDDELADQRKNRHTEFHTNEKVGTSKRPRNWTFGETNYELKSLELKVKILGLGAIAGGLARAAPAIGGAVGRIGGGIKQVGGALGSQTSEATEEAGAKVAEKPEAKQEITTDTTDDYEAPEPQPAEPESETEEDAKAVGGMGVGDALFF